MSATTAKPILEQKIVELLADQPDLFLVQLKIDAKNNIHVFLDGDNGISIGQCTKLSRSVYPFIEEAGWFPNDDFSLEVSSAGIEEPLILERQFIKNVGRGLDIIMSNGETTEGKLLAIEASVISIETTTGKGKKAVIATQAINLSDIKSAIVQIKF